MRGILLDIEGTTSSIRFVYDVMFPFARRELDGYLRAHWNSDALCEACELIAGDAGHESFADWMQDAADESQARETLRDEVCRLMDADVKATGLKQLQGLIWRSGFESGEMRAHVYDDVPPALQRWSEAGVDIRVYSSGSVAAQKLFFRHTVAGDLLPYFRGHYDTTTGGKRERGSYERIARQFELPPDEIVFVSDVTDELAAAREAGLQVLLALRPDNPPAADQQRYQAVRSFAEIGPADS